MIPPVNSSILPRSKIKGRPASSARNNPTYYDWACIYPNAKAVGDKNLKIRKYKDDINSPMKQIGINHNPSMIMLPCRAVNDLPNKRIKGGEGIPFSYSTVAAQPMTGLSRLYFSKSERLGEFGGDLKQRPFAFSSF